MGSLSIDTVEFNCLAWPESSIEMALDWIQDEGEYWSASDRSAAQDIFRSEIVIVGTNSTIHDLQDLLDANRGTLSLTDFGTDIFAPIVDHAGEIFASLDEPKKRKHRSFVNPSENYSEIPLVLRAHAPDLLSVTPSLATLRVLPGWEGDRISAVSRGFAHDGTPYFTDPNSEIGELDARFDQTTAELKAILAYLLITARGAPFVLPTIPGIDMPFGSPKGAGPFNAVARSFSFRRTKLDRWTLDVKFCEAP